MEQVRPQQAYLVLFLTAVATLSIVDRQIMAMMIGPMRRDLGISDTMMGLLGGFAFAIFYALLSLPAAHLADTRNRSRLILASVALFSLMAAGCALVHRYALLFLLRMGVSVGAAAISPTSYSLMSATVPPRHLPMAIGLFSAAPFLGTSIASIGGGALIAYLESGPPLVLPVVGALRSWQATFLLIGALGLGLCVLGALTLREPPRAPLVAGQGTPGEIAAFLRARSRLLVLHFASLSLMSIQGWALLYWLIEFFVRQHAMGRAEIGFFYGIVSLVCGLGGSLAAGIVVSMMMRRGSADAPLRIIAIALLFLLPLAIALPLVRSTPLALGLLVPLTFAMALPGGPATTALQLIVPPHLKARIIALYLVVVNFIALSLGPLVTGLISDTVFGGQSIGASLAVMAVVIYPLSLVCILLARAPYRAAVAAAEQRVATPAPAAAPRGTLVPEH